MDNYKIVFYNEILKKTKERVSTVQTFQEAARDANLIRCKLGLEWQILSVTKEEKKCQD